MKMIAAIGTKDGRFIRANTGVRVLENLAARHDVRFHSMRNYRFAESRIGNQAIILVRPQTEDAHHERNKCGVAFRNAMYDFNVLPTEFVVVHDSMAINLGSVAIGNVRQLGFIRHGGLASTVTMLEDADFLHLSVGILDGDFRRPTYAYTQSPFRLIRRNQLRRALRGIAHATLACEALITSGLDAAQNLLRDLES